MRRRAPNHAGTRIPSVRNAQTREREGQRRRRSAPKRDPPQGGGPPRQKPLTGLFRGIVAAGNQGEHGLEHGGDVEIVGTRLGGGAQRPPPMIQGRKCGTGRHAGERIARQTRQRRAAPAAVPEQSLDPTVGEPLRDEVREGGARLPLDARQRRHAMAEVKRETCSGG